MKKNKWLLWSRTSGGYRVTRYAAAYGNGRTKSKTKAFDFDTRQAARDNRCSSPDCCDEIIIQVSR